LSIAFVTERAIEVLLVEDNPADVYLMMTALRDGRVKAHVHVVNDGEEALHFLRRERDFANSPRPDIVLLYLNLRGVPGLEVLTNIKADPELRRIPVVVISNSDAERDVFGAYDSHVASYIVKPSNVDDYFAAIRTLKELWFHIVELPPKSQSASQ